MKDYYQKERYKEPNLAWLAQTYSQRRLNQILKVYGKTLKGKILDVGCGEGALLHRIGSEFRDTRLFGLDISKKGCNIARKRGINAKVADLNKPINYKADMFDVVIATEIIEHLVDPDLFLDEILRILKPGGSLLLTTPNLLAWNQRILCLFGYVPTFYELSTRDRTIGLGPIKKLTSNSQPVGHIRVFNKIGLEEMLRKAGFDIIHTSAAPMKYPLPAGLRQIYEILENFWARFPGLGSNLIVHATKITKK